MNYYDEHEENDNIKLTARRVEDNSLVHASTVTKNEGPFYCPDTFEELIVRKCIEERDHFAYKARQSPVGSKESDLHKACKKEICSILQKRFPDGKWETFRDNGVELLFLEPAIIEYGQYKKPFVPMLSIIDLLMFNPKEKALDLLNNYRIV